MTISPWPVIRAWRPFVRRISMWKEALGSSDTEVLARRDALREELASAPSLACEIVGVLVCLGACITIARAIDQRDVPLLCEGLAAATLVWLLPGHRWYFAFVRAIGLSVFFATSEALRSDLATDTVTAAISGRLIKPPADALTLPVAFPLAIIGFVLVAIGLRVLSRAPELPRWGAGVTVALAVITFVGTAVDYRNRAAERLAAHEAFARRVEELRRHPDEPLSVVRHAMAQASITEEASSRLSDLEIAFPYDPTVVEFRRTFDSIVADQQQLRENALAREERAREAANAREQRARQIQENRANAAFNFCVSRCSAPFFQCTRMGYRPERCADEYQTEMDCMRTCAN